MTLEAMERTAAAEPAACPQGCTFQPAFKDVAACPVCGLGRSRKAAGAPHQRNYLGPDADGAKTARPRHLYDAFMSRCEPGSLLDVGCSDGFLLDLAAANGWRVLGVDPQPDGSGRIVRADFLNHRFAERFDFVTLIHSFEHMDDPSATLHLCRALIAENGRLLIVVPNFGGWWSRAMGRDWQWLNVDDHRYHFTRGAMTRLLEQSGFRIEICRTCSAFAPSLPEMTLTAKRVFDWRAIRARPVRSALYRLSRLAGAVCNPLADLAGQGAELQVLARPV